MIFYIPSILSFACYCVHIFTVNINSSYFNVYSNVYSLSCQWYAKSMMLLYNTNNDAENNGGNLSLGALVLVGMKNFSIDL